MRFRRSRHTLTTVGLAGVLASCIAPEDPTLFDSVLLKGSDTMRDLVTICGNAFSERHPRIQVRVAGGGSGTGIHSLMSGLTEIAMSSRNLTEREIYIAKRKGLAVHTFPIAKDGMAVIVHPDNPVSALTMIELRQVFIGEVTDWSALGGSEGPIHVHVREALSGTQVFFRNEVLEGIEYINNVTIQGSNRNMVEAIASDPQAIGYMGLMYTRDAEDRVRALPLRMNATVQPPSRASIRTGGYPLARPLYLMTIVTPRGAMKDFIDFIRGPNGQTIVEQVGFVSVKMKRRDSGSAFAPILDSE